MFQLENDRRAPPRRSEFADNERTKQTMLLSGLKCMSGQKDLFPDLDSFPKETCHAKTHPDRSPD